MPFNQKEIGRAVRQLRVAAGLTQAELAERAGLAFETVSRVEGGREPPSLRTAISLSDALGVSLDAVVGRVPTPAVRKEEPASRDLRKLLAAAERLEPTILRHVVAVARALPASRPGKRGR
jgi:transcriptional regulator with XRE-family HTH domain